MDFDKNVYSWLPDIIKFEDYDYNYFKYNDACYKFFLTDFTEEPLLFEGIKVIFNFKNKINGKAQTYWHIVNEKNINSTKEEERLPNLRRYERIRWVPAILKNYLKIINRVKIWKNYRRNGISTLLWLPEIEYLIIFRYRNKKSYTVFITAYPVSETHSKRKLQKEYEEYIKTVDAPF